MARAVIRRTRERVGGVAENPQARDKMADVMMRENGVVEPINEEPQGDTDEPQPGMLRVYDAQGRKTRAVVNPAAHPKPMVLSRRGLEKSGLSATLKQKVADGQAHWVTIKEGPLEGRHLLIDGARPEKGQTSHGKILAGHGIPAHVIEKISGATRAEHLPHKVTPALSQWLTEQRYAHETTPAPIGGGESHQITLGHGYQTETVKHKTKYGTRTHEETQRGHLNIRATVRGGFLIDSAFEDKDDLKADGARWDAEIRKWYAPNNATLERILRDRAHFPHVTVTADATRVYEHLGDHQHRAHAHEDARGETPDAGSDLPALQGSEKQIAWAQDIRQQQLDTIRAVAQQTLRRKPKEGLTDAEMEQVQQHKKLIREWLAEHENQTSAKWWIDHRATGFIDWYKDLQRTAQRLHKSRARDTRGAFIRVRRPVTKAGTPQKSRRGSNPNPPVVRKKRPRPGMLPKESGNPLGSPMQESSMQVLGAITQSKRRERPRQKPDWGFDPQANLPGKTAKPKPIGAPNVFMYKSDPVIQDALTAYRALLDQGKSPAVATHVLSTRYAWVLTDDTPKGRQWWAAVRRAQLPRPRAFDLDDAVDTANERPKRAVFWKETPANLGQGIGAPTGSGSRGG